MGTALVQNTGFTVSPTQVIYSTGSLWGCGYNYFGQLGDGSRLSTKDLNQIGSLNNWSQIADCGYGVGAIKTDGSLWVLGGYNTFGTIGNGTTISYSSPIQIGSLTNWSKIYNTQSSLFAIKTDGTLWSWGRNIYGELGNGTTTNYSSPIQIGSLTNWSKLGTGGYHWGAVKTDGTLWMCGYNGSWGALGNGTTTNYSSPIQIGSLTNWSQVACGQRHSLMLKTDGTLWGCGYNTHGQLGNSSSGIGLSYSSPIQIGSLTNWSKIACSGFASFGTKTDGSLWSWGQNSYGELGNGTTINYSSPIQIGLLTNWSQINSTLGYNIAAIGTDGSLWVWGNNSQGQFGNRTVGNRYSSPIQVGSLSIWGSVSINDSLFAIPSSTQTYTYGQQAIYSGGLWVCGYNQYGELGNGTNGNSYSSPIQVGLTNDWSKISYTTLTALAIKTNGTLWAWGYGGNGELGNGTATNGYSSPIQIGALTNWSQVSGGGAHWASVKTDGTLWTCGYNNNGELGRGTNGVAANVSSPVQVGLLTNWKNVYAGHRHTAAIKTDGTLWTWGLNSRGQLGNGTTINYSSPIQIGALTNWSQIGCGYAHTAAIKTDGTLWAWGRNYAGALGNGTTVYYSSPIQIGALTNWSQVSCGYHYTAAIKTDGTLWTCGYNYVGALGNGTITSYSSPIQIGALTNWSQVSCGLYHLAASKTDGTVWTCGYNNYGNLCNGTTINYSSPIQVGSLSNWGSVAACRFNTSLIPSSNQIYIPPGQDLGQRYVSKDYLLDVYPNIASATGNRTSPGLWAWGNDSYGQLGNGTTIKYSSPIQIGALTNWKQICGSYYYTAAIKTDGTLWWWGSGIGSAPVQIGSLTNWNQFALGDQGIAQGGIKTDGTLWIWGNSTYGTVGNGTTANYNSPVQIGILTNWKQVDFGLYHTAAIKTNGTLWTWGFNDSGQLGNGTKIKYSSPIQIGSLTNWSQVSCGGNSTVAVKTDGTLWTWGFNDSGQLGNGTTIDYSSPIQVGLLTNWKQVSLGTQFTSAIKTDGTLWIWGYNAGKLGNGTTIDYSSPIQVGLLTNWKQVSLGTQFTSAIKTDGTLWTWGGNTYGGLGNGTTTDYLSPIQVGSLTNWKQVAAGSSHLIAISDGYY